tara:strand:+ start:2112 stop:2879 length:768 start_codon:yes stop_codon:yes gene_type:complete
MIKKITNLFFLLCSITLLAQEKEFYQLKIYSFDTKQQEETTDVFLETAYLPALKRQKITDIGVFKTRDIDSVNRLKTYVLIPFNSLSQFESLESSLSNDALFLKDGSAYLKSSYDNAPYKRISSIVLKAFIDHPKLTTPKLKGPREERIYELRSYESATENLFKNKVDMFNAGGEVKLFDRLDFNAVFYGEVISGPVMPNLMYLTTFENQESRDLHWQAFGDAPEWTILKEDPKYQNNVSSNIQVFLYPTDYSDY